MQRVQNEMLPLHRREMRIWWERQEGIRLTWRQVLGVATGVHQNIGLKGGVKVVICTEEGQMEKWHDLLKYDGCVCVCVCEGVYACFTCCRAGCLASTPGLWWSGGFSLRGARSGSTGDSGRTNSLTHTQIQSVSNWTTGKQFRIHK